MSRIHIPAAPATTGYDVLIRTGAIAELPDLLARAAPSPHYAIISDATVAELHGGRVLDRLREANVRADLFSFPPGERHKTRSEWARLTDALLDAGMGRDGCVLALGGGVTTDLAGFVAAAFMRGVALVQLPASLLAMIDASVGAKTGVNTPAGKNLTGAFHAPRAVVADPTLLDTLPERELRNGLAEAIKHGAIADADYLDWIGRAAADLFAGDRDALSRLIRRSVQIKADVVSEDPRERGRRSVLNFGHTVGHAIEQAADYALPHGHAVAIGMAAEAEAGERAGVTPPGTADAIRGVLTGAGLPIAPPPGVEPAELVELAHRDKKARRQRVRYTLLARPGEAARTDAGEWTFALDDELVAGVLTASPSGNTPAAGG